MNGILPARGGDALKIVLAKRGVERSSYPTIRLLVRGSCPVRHPRWGCWCCCTRSPRAYCRGRRVCRTCQRSRSPSGAAHPQALLLLLTLIGIGAVALVATLSRRAESFWQRVKQGLAIFREPARYAREVAGWQLVGWLCASPRSGSSSTLSTSAARSRTCSW